MWLNNQSACTGTPVVRQAQEESQLDAQEALGAGAAPHLPASRTRSPVADLSALDRGRLLDGRAAAPRRSLLRPCHTIVVQVAVEPGLTPTLPISSSSSALAHLPSTRLDQKKSLTRVGSQEGNCREASDSWNSCCRATPVEHSKRPLRHIRRVEAPLWTWCAGRLHRTSAHLGATRPASCYRSSTRAKRYRLAALISAGNSAAERQLAAYLLSAPSLHLRTCYGRLAPLPERRGISIPLTWQATIPSQHPSEPPRGPSACG
jgi:hypothetical protein